MTAVGRAITVGEENSSLKGLKVLVIDDSKTIRRTAETLLNKRSR
jgi:PleD family two-component response regulator